MVAGSSLPSTSKGLLLFEFDVDDARGPLDDISDWWMWIMDDFFVDVNSG